MCGSETQLQCTKEAFIPRIYTVCSRFTTLTFWPLCHSSTIAKRISLQCKQPELINRFWREFTSSVWHFCSWEQTSPPRNFPNSKEWRNNSCILQASTYWNRLKLYYIHSNSCITNASPANNNIIYTSTIPILLRDLTMTILFILIDCSDVSQLLVLVTTNKRLYVLTL